MLKKLFLFSITGLFFLESSFANMASPIREGTKASSALSSKDIDVLKEQIHIKINKDFTSAKFTITYTIKNNLSSNQIPLLFLALDYQSDFKVWLNDHLVKVKIIPDEYLVLTNPKFKPFDQNFKPLANDEKQVEFYFEKNQPDTYDFKDLKYFETLLDTGIHQIKVEYIAKSWEDRSDWVKDLSFRYSLSPAKYWKSFSSLSIKVEQEGDQIIHTNLGKGKNVNGQFIYWYFNSLPADFLTIGSHPKQSDFVNAIIWISPDGFMWIAFGILCCIHLLVLYSNRNSSERKLNLIVILGSLLIPFITFLVYNLSFSFIDGMIGKDASRFHGYYILIFGIYPFVMPIYWLIIYLINRFLFKVKA